MIGDRIHDTILGPKLAADHLIQSLSLARNAMQVTPLQTASTPPHHPAVAETIKWVQGIFQVLEQTKRDPWIMVASALLMGCVIGHLNRGNVLTVRQATTEVENPGLGTTASTVLLSSSRSSPSQGQFRH